ncbi:MAG TPA: FHA domain-containing protein, partial [Vicinamibacteria bacterium]|nr:FHA domain-containing protein [Vicinamibacteria bacterium]
MTGGASDGLEVQLESPGAEKTIGSSPSSHIRLTARNVDAGHARITWDDGAIVLSDEGSAAGTFVNGEKVVSGHVLQDGDRISVGPPGSPESVRLLVRVPADLSAAAEAAPFLPRPGSDPAPSFTGPAAAEEDALPAFTIEAEESEPVVFEEAAAAPTPPPGAARAAPPAIVFEEAPVPPAPPADAPAPVAAA